MCPLARPTHRVRVGGAGRDYIESIRIGRNFTSWQIWWAILLAFICILCLLPLCLLEIKKCARQDMLQILHVQHSKTWTHIFCLSPQHVWRFRVWRCTSDVWLIMILIKIVPFNLLLWALFRLWSQLTLFVQLQLHYLQSSDREIRHLHCPQRENRVSIWDWLPKNK